MKIETDYEILGDRVYRVYQHQEDRLWKCEEVSFHEIRTHTDYRGTAISYRVYGGLGWTSQADIFRTEAAAKAEMDKRNK